MIGMSKHICNMCGKEFDMWDTQANFEVCNKYVGYGSKFDGSKIQLNLCCECMDKLIESCKVSPISFE